MDAAEVEGRGVKAPDSCSVRLSTFTLSAAVGRGGVGLGEPKAVAGQDPNFTVYCMTKEINTPERKYLRKEKMLFFFSAGGLGRVK